ncbi:MAG: ABC transporter ATP-binding protein [Chitinophagales bacterium]|nr:ABC transporter ATP-binding protein [Chitinophagales bacterium]
MSIFSNIFSSDPQKKDDKLSFNDQLNALKNLPEFFKLIWETDKTYTVINVFLRLIQAAIPLAMLYVGKLIIDEIILQISADEKLWDLLWIYLAIEFGLAILSEVLSRMINLYDSLLGDLFSNKTSVKLIEHAATLDLYQFEDAEFYDKLERARRQTVGRVMLMSQVLSQLQDIITVMFLSGGLIIFSPLLLVILALAIIPSFIGESHFNERSYSLSRSWTPERRELDYLRYIGASDDTAKEIKIFNLAGFLSNRFKILSDKYYLANKKLATNRAVWGTLFSGIGTLSYYGAYVYIIVQTVNGAITVGDLTFLAGSFSRLRNLLQAIMNRFSKIAESALYLKDMFDFFNIKPRISNPDKPKEFPKPIKEGIKFENVSFRYPNAIRNALSNISFEIKAGEKMALVGENGAGKTTLVKLIARLYEPTEGRILIDGIDIREYSLSELRNEIGIIFQDYVRFHMRAYENIAVGNIPRLTERDEIVDSAEKSLADRVIQELPEEYEQMLGRRFEKGVELSGGQWQKIALARAYMREAEILILDEPTSALDARAEHEVFQRFSDLIKGKTAVLISHRFSTVRMADRILFLEDGKVKELGSHDELVKFNGKYAELFSLQAKGYT